MMTFAQVPLNLKVGAIVYVSLQDTDGDTVGGVYVTSSDAAVTALMNGIRTVCKITAISEGFSTLTYTKGSNNYTQLVTVKGLDAALHAVAVDGSGF